MKLFAIEKDGKLKPYTERVYKNSNQEGILFYLRINSNDVPHLCRVMKGSFGSYVQSH
jgi:hypothetical protein